MSDVEVKFGGTTSELDAAAKRAEEDIAGVSAAAQKASGGFTNFNSTNKEVVKGMKLTGYQAQVLSYQLNDVFSGLLTGQKPMQILMQQGPQITQIFGGLRGTFAALAGALTPAVIAIGALTAVIGVCVAAVVKFEMSQQALEMSTLGAGRAAGTTAGEMDALAVEMSRTAGVSTNAAQEMASSFAQTGKIGVEMFGGLIEISRDYQYAMGIDAKEATEELGEAMGDPIAGAEMLNDRMGLLDDTTTQLIKTMVEQGRTSEAQAILLDKLGGAVDGASNKAHGLAKAWHAVASGASNAFDWLGRAISRASLMYQFGGQELTSRIFGGTGIITQIDNAKRLQAENDKLAAQSARAQADANRQSVQAGEAARALLPKEAQTTRLRNQIELLRRSAAAGTIEAATATRAIKAAEAQIADLAKPKAGRSGGNAAANKAQREREAAARDAFRLEIASLDRQQQAVENNFAEWNRIQDLKIEATRQYHGQETQEYEKAMEAKEEFARRFAVTALRTEIAGIDRQQKAQEDNLEAWNALQDQKIARIIEIHGIESDDYQRALAQKEQYARAYEDRMRALEVDRLNRVSRNASVEAQTTLQIAQLQMQSERELLDQMQAQEAINEAQKYSRLNSIVAKELSLQIDAANTIYNVQRKTLEDTLALAGLETDEKTKLKRDLEDLEAQHQQNIMAIRSGATAQMLTNDRMAAMATYNTWKGQIGQMSGAFTGMFTQWGAGIQDFRTGWQAFGRSILGVIEGAVTKMVEKWIMGQLGLTTATIAGESTRTAAQTAGSTARTAITAAEAGASVAAESTEVAATTVAEVAKTAATAAGAATRVATETAAAATTTSITASTSLMQIAARAATAAAGAYAAVAAIPVVGPFLAPAMAATALAGVLALGNRIFSAEGGWGQVPKDGMVTELHKDEMVLPAYLANPLRNGISNIASGSRGALATGASSAGNLARETMSKTLSPAFTYAPTISSGGNQSLENLLAREGSGMRKWLNRQIRDGKLKV